MSKFETYNMIYIDIDGSFITKPNKTSDTWGMGMSGPYAKVYLQRSFLLKKER